MRSWLIAPILLALAACGQSNPTPVTVTTPLDTASAAAHAAADKFVAMSGAASATGQAPRQTDPAVAPLLNAVFNTAALPATAPAAGPEVDALIDWLNSANRIGQVYILAGTDAASVANATTAMEQQADLNVVTYAPEMGRFFDTEMALMSLEAGGTAQSLAADPGQTNNAQDADGLAKMRSGVAQTASGILVTLQLPGLTPDWQEARAKALVAFAPNAAKLLLPADRANLQTQATQAAATTSDPTLKAEYAQFATLIGVGS